MEPFWPQHQVCHQSKQRMISARQAGRQQACYTQNAPQGKAITAAMSSDHPTIPRPTPRPPIHTSPPHPQTGTWHLSTCTSSHLPRPSPLLPTHPLTHPLSPPPTHLNFVLLLGITGSQVRELGHERNVPEKSGGGQGG